MSTLSAQDKDAQKEPEICPDKIVDFYENANVFITGGTGFVGKSLIEKLLRTCTNLNTIYVLIRGKKGKKSQERLEELLSNPVFNVIRSNSPEVLKKVKAIEGDVMFPNLGIVKEDITLLMDQVHVVFHAAATVKFNERLSSVLTLNTLGTSEIVELCCQMKRIKSFVYVSTAYCNTYTKDVLEVVYKPKQNPREMLDLLKTNPERLDELSQSFCENHPNTYTYSKALSEYILLDYVERFPIAIVRPSIVGSSWKEPFPGWVDGWSLINLFVVEVQRGNMNTFLCNKDITLDIIPVDVVANTLVASAWHIHHYRKKMVTVYNCTSGCFNGIRCEQIIKIVEKLGVEYPGSFTMFYPNVTITSSKTFYDIYMVIFRTIPAYLYDFALMLFRRKPIMCKWVRKVNKAWDVLLYFLLNDWNFRTENMTRLQSDSKSAQDGASFNMDVRKENDFVWADYLKDYVLGLREHLLKEDLKNLPQAKSRLSRIYWSTKSVQILVVFVLFKLAVRVINSMS